MAADRLSRDHRLNTLPATVSGLAVIVAAALTLSVYEFGAQSAQMALHIALMNVAAPLMSAVFAAKLPSIIGRPRIMWFAAGVQLILLWGWHIPILQQAAMASHAVHMLMQTTLFFAALLFWSAIILLPATARWQAIAALLLTGKLACLLSALLIFSPRALYDLAGHAGKGLDDQQLAGLLMITACPISYVIAAVVIAAQIVGRLAEAPPDRIASRPG